MPATKGFLCFTVAKRCGRETEREPRSGEEKRREEKRKGDKCEKELLGVRARLTIYWLKDNPIEKVIFATTLLLLGLWVFCHLKLFFSCDELSCSVFYRP